MREIKFRGKTGTGNWVYGDLTFSRYGNPYIGSLSKIWSGVKRNTVSQYTGMNDSTGKEIYEGDIVEINEEEDYYGERIGDVCFLDVGGCWYINGVEDGVADIDRNYHIDVIGNRWDNPELLGGAHDEH